MSTFTIESESKPDVPAAPTKGGRKAANRAKATRKAPAAKKLAGKALDRTNKKVEVSAMMKRAKGGTLAEIIETTGCQRHPVRGFVSILGSKGAEKVELSKNAAGERTYKIAQ